MDLNKIPLAKCYQVLAFFMVINSFGQEQRQNPNILYENFSKAYREKNAILLEELYMQDAVLLNLYDSSGPNSIQGKTAIKNYFSNFFKIAEKNGQELRLTFKIIRREELEDAVLDNGFYKLTIIDRDKPEIMSHGKLSTVLKWDLGNWKFMVDANTDTNEIEYRNATTGSIPQPKDMP